MTNTKPEREPVIIFDGGTMGCGELVLELRFKMADLNAGDLLKVVALDPGAPEDLPAWCKMTGHLMVYQNHPEYWIAKRGN